MTDVVEVVYPVMGRHLHPSYAYPLFGALCGACVLKGRPEIAVGPIEHVVSSEGLLRLTHRSQIRFRAPVSSLDFVSPFTLCPLRVGEHVITLGDPVVREPRPSSVLWAEWVTFASGRRSAPEAPPSVRVRRSLHRYIETHWSWMSADQVVIGRLVRRVISRYVTWGYPIELRDLSPAQSISLQSTPVGGRRHFGAGVLIPGALPRDLYENSKHRRRRAQTKRIHVPASDGAHG